MIIVFLGSPGVGKGTQAVQLCEARGYRHVSTGELLREAVTAGSDLGKRAKSFMDSGALVPDDVMLGLIEGVIKKHRAGLVLDGFPRTIVQAEELDTMLEGHGLRVDRVILLTADEEEVVRRLLARGRADDTLETVKNRLRVYRESTEPLVEYYRRKDILREVEGMGSIPEIQARVLDAAKAA